MEYHWYEDYWAMPRNLPRGHEFFIGYQCPCSEQKHCCVFSDTAIMIAQETGCEDDWQE